MSKRFEFFIALLCLLSSKLNGEIESKNLPNILICVSNNHAVRLLGDLNELGSSLDPTPNLTKMLVSGGMHPLAYCTNAGTNSPLVPLLCGKTKLEELNDLNSSNTLAHFFKLAGYETAFFGSCSWLRNPSHLGFDYWKLLKDSEISINPMIKGLNNNYVIEGHATDIITDLVIDWLHSRENTKPFIAIVSYQSTIRPWIPPLRLINQYNDEWFETPSTFFSDMSTRAPPSKYQRMNIGTDLDPKYDLFLSNDLDINKTISALSIWEKNWLSMNQEQKTAWSLAWKSQNEAFSRETSQSESTSIWKYQRFLKNYLRCLFAMDQNIGRIIETISSDLPVSCNFFYTSQKGNFTGEFGWFGNDWMYDPSSRIPFIFGTVGSSNAYIPKLPKLLKDYEIHHVLKKIPSFSIPSVPGHQRKNSYHKSNFNNRLYFSHTDYPGKYRVSPHHGVREGRYKIIHYYPFDEWEFFDLEKDPMEVNNLLFQEPLSKIIEEYKKKLEESAALSFNEQNQMKFTEKWKREQRSPKNKMR